MIIVFFSGLLLGSLSHAQIKRGYETLAQIETVLNTKYNRDKLTELSSKFYTEVTMAGVAVSQLLCCADSACVWYETTGAD